MRVGILDIGSNSVLLLVAERVETGWRVLTDQARITRLGEGFGTEQMLQSHAIERTLQAIEEYLAICRTLGVEHVITAATAVIREAKNREVFVEAVKRIFPSSPDPRSYTVGEGEVKISFPVSQGMGARAEGGYFILSEADEARLSFLSVARDSDLGVGGELLAVVDIGGGSVEVALGRNDVERGFSFPVGAGRIRETHMPSDPPDPREVLRSVRFLDETFAPLRDLPQPERVVAIGGTGVNLAMLALGVTEFDPVKVHGVWFGDETLPGLLERLLRLSDTERRALPGIEPDRAPLLHIGALILERALFALRREEVQISTRGLRYGILWSL
ncbi:MAG: hypothetical protein N2651_10105 [Fimbriimonadales bacterium]|nr:hypothetical protein [Fimbriimonadales bacterium]